MLAKTRLNRIEITVSIMLIFAWFLGEKLKQGQAMLKSNLAILIAAGLLAGCVYERNEAYAPPPYRETAREPARPLQAAVPRPDRIRSEDLGTLNPDTGTAGPDAEARRPARATPSPTRLHSSSTLLFVQAASFVTRDQAERAREAIAGLGPTGIYTAYVEDQLRYRVRVGPLATPERTERVRAALIRRGYPDAIVVRD